MRDVAFNVKRVRTAAFISNVTDYRSFFHSVGFIRRCSLLDMNRFILCVMVTAVIVGMVLLISAVRADTSSELIRESAASLVTAIQRCAACCDSTPRFFATTIQSRGNHTSRETLAVTKKKTISERCSEPDTSVSQRHRSRNKRWKTPSSVAQSLFP